MTIMQLILLTSTSIRPYKNTEGDYSYEENC